MHSKYLKFFILSLGILVVFDACNQKNLCVEPQLVGVRGGFYQRDTANTLKDTLLKNANIIFGNNLTYFQNIKKFNKFKFPLSQQVDSALVIFQSDSLQVAPNTIDSLLFMYQRDLNFISSSCGYETIFNLYQVKYTTNVIDTVMIQQQEVTSNANFEHVKIVIQK